jgi:hypothetical protein
LKPDILDWAALMPFKPLHTVRLRVVVVVVVQLDWPFPEKTESAARVEALPPSKWVLLGAETLDHFHQVGGSVAVILGTVDPSF